MEWWEVIRIAPTVIVINPSFTSDTATADAAADAVDLRINIDVKAKKAVWMLQCQVLPIQSRE